MKFKKQLVAKRDLVHLENNLIMPSFNSIWSEKFRPKTLSDIVLKAEIKQLILNYTKQQEIPNLLFVNKPGCGKSSLARILVNDVLKCQYLYINASDENGIDTVREKITSFAQTKSIDGGIKVIILDEAEGISESGQRALRNTMEEYAKYTRFILTANQLHKVIPAIQSRCQSITIESDLFDVVKRCLFILKQEGITIEEADKPQLLHVIKTHFPDIRRTINMLQKMCASGKFIANSVSKSDEFADELLQMIFEKKNCKAVRQHIIENEDRFANDYQAMLKTLLQSIYANDCDEKKKQVMICIVAEHLYRTAFAMDQEINAFHCCLNLLNV